MENLNISDFEIERDNLHQNLLNYEICTEDELALVISINGYTIDSMNSILYSRTGYRSWDQFSEIFLEEEE